MIALESSGAVGGGWSFGFGVRVRKKNIIVTRKRMPTKNTHGFLSILPCYVLFYMIASVVSEGYQFAKTAKQGNMVVSSCLMSAASVSGVTSGPEAMYNFIVAVAQLPISFNSNFFED